MPMNVPSQEPVVEVLHGRIVVDPYRWLEDRNSPATAAWISNQRQRHDAYFFDIPGFDWLRGRVSTFLNVEVLDQPARLGSRYFYRCRKKDQEQGCICVRSATTGTERVLVDPSKQSPFAAVAIHRISDDGSLLAYEMRDGGSDAKAIHIVDVEEGRILPDHLEIGYARGFAFAADGTGYYYCHEFLESLEPHTVRFHHFGEATCEDEVLLRLDRKQQSKLVLLADESHLGAILSYANGAGSLIDFYLSHQTRNSPWTPVLANKKSPYGVFLSNGHIFAITEEGGTRRHIIELTEDGTPFRIVVPEWDHEIERFTIAAGNIFAAYLVDRKPVVRKWTLAGEYAGALEIPDDGSIQLLSGFSTGSDSLFYAYESFANPPSVYEFIAPPGRHLSWTARAGSELGKLLRVKEVSYLSKDGTEVPMSLVMRGDVNQNQTRPVILTSYGGFGVSMTPKFSVFVTIMVELGAIFALPNIRGGSEFGKAWHEAARARNRQVAFDDFIAAAEWVCTQGITTPEQLAIFGGSNSGLLVGACMTQRPGLFSAVLCIAPLLDMVRYEQFDSARKWRHEYGTAEDPRDFEALYAYSPYHHVHEDVNYPSTLFVSGDKDDRCNPAHVRKMAALLQTHNSQLNPILVDYNQHRGHVPVLPLCVRIEALARRIAFICYELGMNVPSGVNS
jgi:prolyl oligopeptidase